MVDKYYLLSETFDTFLKSLSTLKTHSSTTTAKQTRAIIYSLVLPNQQQSLVEKRSQECEQLLSTYGGKVNAVVIQKRHHFSANTYIAIEKLEEIISLAIEKSANLLLINASLKPKQIFSIENRLEEKKLDKKIRVWDREDLIISIFSQHAKSSTAKLQLELAKLEHFGPRIFGMGEDLSQQGGGIGTRGLGETNTEIMKRHISMRKKRIKLQLAKLIKVRQTNRKKRKKIGFKSISLIGYTNAGKSALFRALAKQPNTLVEDKLFATLDTKISKVYLPKQKCSVLLSDTIGFIEDLPHRLKDAFRSTLEETIDTDLLLQIVDISDPNFKIKMEAIEKILCELECAHLPRIFVYNKIDKLGKNNPLSDISVAKDHCEFNSLYVSAKANIHLDLLCEKIGNWLFQKNSLE